jgi:glutaconate CoA-transferase subunit B
VILFQPEHSTRTLVPRVDFVTAPGVSPEGVYRPGGPVALVTGRCVFGFDRAAARFRLESVHPGQTVDDVREHTGFDFDLADVVATTPEPDAETLALLRGKLGRAIAETYPGFAARVLGIGA